MNIRIQGPKYQFNCVLPFIAGGAKVHSFEFGYLTKIWVICHHDPSVKTHD